MLLKSGVFVVLLAGLLFAGADDPETEKHVAELEVETLVSSVKFFFFLTLSCLMSFVKPTHSI